MKKILVCMAFLAAIINLKGQIVFNGSTTKSGSGVSSLTFTKTVTAGNNVLLIVGITVQDKNITNVSFGGTNLTQFTLATRNSMRVGLYYLPMGNLAVSVTSNVVVSIASASDAFAGAADYSGVWQPAPFVNPSVAQAKNNRPTITFTSAVGHKAISLLGDISATPTANGPGQTQYWTFTGSHSNRACEKNGAASVTMSHTLSANEDWVMLGGTMQDFAVITLPIELSEFKAQRLSSTDVGLTWKTASEYNNDYFSVEKSDDGIQWKEIGKIKGTGTTSLPQKYLYVDKLEAEEQTLLKESNLIYYRLTQIDYDGSKKTYDVVSVSALEEDETELVVYPNPATGEKVNLHIDLQNSISQATIKIFSCHGHLIFKSTHTLTKGDNNLQLNHQFEKGVYIVNLYSGNSLITYKKLLVQ